MPKVATAAPTAPAGRSLWNGFGEALAQAIELAGVPVLFTLFGIALDGWFGTRPLLTATLATFGITGVIVKTLYAYKAQMEEQEKGKPWTRRSR